jgi:hypothetical protein
MTKAEKPFHGTPDAFRHFIAETLAFAQIQADLGATYAALGDDVGLEYAVACLVAYATTASTVLKDMKEAHNA